MDLRMMINQRLRLSPTLYDQYEPFTDFKADFHNLYVMQGGIPRRHGTSCLLVAEEDVVEIMGKWPLERITPSEAGAGTSKVAEDTTAQTTTIEKHKEPQKVAFWEKVAQQKEVDAQEKEAADKAWETQETTTSQATIDVEEFDTQQTPEQEETGEEEGGG